MQIAQLSVKPLADNLAVPDDHRSNERIRADSPAPALGKLKSPLQVRPVRACQLRIHATD
jgi:hypothetical protein